MHGVGLSASPAPTRTRARRSHDGPLLVTLDRATDIIWTLASPDVARMLCDQRGWTTDDYADWLEETLAAILFPRPARRRAGRG